VSSSGGCVWSTLLAASFAGLGLKTRARFRGGTDGTWRHRGVRVEAKLPHEGRSGYRMETMLGWSIMPLWLAGSL